MDDIKIGDRYYAPWAKNGTGSCFTIFGTKVWNKTAYAYMIRWDHYDDTRELRDLEDGRDHDGFVTERALRENNITSKSPIFKIKDDKHLMELILRHG